MLIRRNLAIALGAVALCLPTVSACGFDLATERPYTPAAGANAYDGTVDVLGAVVVSATPGSGTFVASLSNNDTTGAATFESLAPAVPGDTLEAAQVTPVEIPARGLVNLAVDGGVQLTGDFEAGDFVSVVVGFGSGERAELTVPVVPDEGDFAGLDDATASPTDTATETTEVE